MRRGLRVWLLAGILSLLVFASATAFGPLASFGEFGTGAGQLRAPKQVALDSAGTLYVADSGNNRISVFAGGGAFLSTLTGAMSAPTDVALGANGNLYVADSGNHRVDVFSSAGAFLLSFGETGLASPSGIAVDGSTVYVADTGNDRVAVFTEAGVPLPSIEPVSSPQDVIVGEDGNLYVGVVSGGEGQVDVLSKAGVLLRSFGESGPGALTAPVALAADGAGGIYVADRAAQQVQHFTAAGAYLGGFAAEPNVAGVATGCRGNVFAVEEASTFARIQRFGEPGTPAPPCDGLIVDPIGELPPKPPSNRFRFAGLVKNRSNGSAVLYVQIPGPGKVNLNGRGFRRLVRRAHRATRVRLPVKPKVRLRQFLEQHGKGRIRVAVTFTPTGGIPRTREKVIVLRRHRS
jgi:DNA-binding beta-propeller fold protein YncE